MNIRLSKSPPTARRRHRPALFSHLSFAPVLVWLGSNCPAACPADLDGSGSVDAIDLSIVLGEFGGAGPLGDINGDGLVDAADMAFLLDEWGTCCEPQPEQATLFGAHQILGPQFTYFGDVALADVDANGALDALAIDQNSNALLVWRQSCAGAFDAMESYAMGIGPQAIVLGDLNGDRLIDVATSSYASDSVVLRLALGTGLFGPAAPIPMGDGPIDVLAEDFNGDGAIDLLCANSLSTNIVLRRNAGRGDSFEPPTVVASGFTPISMASGDLDNDGDVDLVVVVQGTSPLRAFRNDGQGTFAPLSMPSFTAAGPQRAIVADLDGDGDRDIAVACSNGDHRDVTILKNLGGAAFAAPKFLAVAYTTRRIEAADVDGDGDRDLVTATQFYTPTVSVLLNDGGGEFAVGEPFVAGGAIESIAVGDVNADGLLDVATSGGPVGLNGVSLLIRDRDGTYGELGRFSCGAQPYSLTEGDLDGDGDHDLVVGVAASVVVLRNLGDGTFSREAPKAVRYPPVGLRLADIDGDSDNDIVAVLLVGGVQIWTNDGAGNFGPPFAYALPTDSLAFDVVDVDGDGDVDLTVLGFANGQAFVALNDGHGVFGPATQYSMNGTQQRSLICQDLNGDGAPDLAAVSSIAYHESELTTRWNVGDGTFGAAITIQLPLSAVALAAGDVDHDGDLDIVCAHDHPNFGPGTISVLLNDGYGGFAPATTYAGLRMPSTPALRDFDQDGNLDVALTGQDGVVMIRYGSGDGALSEPYVYPAGQSGAIVSADVDLDGDLDLATANYKSGDVTIRKNRKLR